MKKAFFAALILAFGALAAGAQQERTGNPPKAEASAAAQTDSKPAVSSQAAKSGTVGSAQKIADVKKLLALTKAGEMGVQMMGEMIQNFRQSLPKVPDAFWLEFAGRLKTEDLVEMIVPAYDRHLSHPEVIALIDFFQSPVGKKLVSIQPEIMKESMEAGRVWGEKIGQEVTAELQKQGYR